MNDTFMETEDSLELEKWWLKYHLGVGRSIAEKLRASGRASSDELLRPVINKATKEITRRLLDEVLVKRGGNFTETATYIMKLQETIPVPVLAHLIIVACVNHLIARPESSLSAVGGSCLKVVTDEYRYRYMELVSPHLVKAVNAKTRDSTFIHRRRAMMTVFSKASQSGYPDFFTSQETKSKVSLALVEVALLARSMFRLVLMKKASSKEKIRCLSIRSEILDLFNRVISIDSFAPLAPSLGIYKHPVPVSRQDFSGYLISRRPLIRLNWLSGRKVQPELIPLGGVGLSCPERAIQSLNDTSYRVNTNMLSWIKAHSARLAYNGYIPELTKKVPKDPTKRAEFYKTWFNSESKRRQYLRTLALAEFLKDSCWYHDWFMDFRGRMYTTNGMLSPQGTGLSKSLIEFDAKVKITRGSTAWFEWFDYGKRLAFGSKIDTRECISEEALLLIINKTLECDWFDVSDAKEYLPWVAWCQVSKELLEKGEAVTGIPIRRDATASSVQHMSTMAADETLMESVNLTKCLTSAPSDVYAGLVNNTGRTRKEIKEYVMTYAYNSTAYGRCKERIRAGSKETLKDLMLQDKMTEEALERELKSLCKVRDAISAYGRVNGWVYTTPSGVKWDGSSVSWPSKQYTIRYNGARLRVRMKSPTGEPELNTRKSEAAYVANVVHSLDASLLHLTVFVWQSPVATIHDCVCVLPGQMDLIMTEIRQVFFRMHEALKRKNTFSIDNEHVLDYNQYIRGSNWMFV